MFFTNTPGYDQQLTRKLSRFGVIWRSLALTMTKVPIVQSLDAGQQEGDCKTQKVYKTEPFDVIERVLVGVFGDRGHDHCEDDI